MSKQPYDDDIVYKITGIFPTQKFDKFLIPPDIRYGDMRREYPIKYKHVKRTLIDGKIDWNTDLICYTDGGRFGGDALYEKFVKYNITGTIDESGNDLRL